MNRRQFLKGVLAVVGAGVVGVPVMGRWERHMAAVRGATFAGAFAEGGFVPKGMSALVTKRLYDVTEIAWMFRVPPRVLFDEEVRAPG